MSVPAEANDDFIDEWLEFIDDEDRVTNDPMEAHYIGFKMWVEAVEKAGTTDPTAVQDAIVRRHRAEPLRRHGHDAGQPPHHQARAHR